MIAAYPGSFDPPTSGHLDLIKRASKMFDKLFIAIGKNSSKTPFLEIAERKFLLWAICEGLTNVSVFVFDGLLVDWCKGMGVNVLVRGLRAVTDFEYELMMAHANRKLAPGVDTIFLATETEMSFVSSSLVKEVFKHGGDITPFVPYPVKDYLENREKHHFTKE